MVLDCASCNAFCCRTQWLELTEREYLDLQEQTHRKINLYRDAGALKILKPPCQFLNEKTNRCSIYEHRPMVCRVYPTIVSMMPNQVAGLGITTSCKHFMGFCQPEQNALIERSLAYFYCLVSMLETSEIGETLSEEAKARIKAWREDKNKPLVPDMALEIKLYYNIVPMNQLYLELGIVKKQLEIGMKKGMTLDEIARDRVDSELSKK